MEEIRINPDGENYWEDDNVENVIDYKLKVIGISMKKIEIERNKLNVIKSCAIKINPIPLSKLDLRSFPFRNRDWKPLHR